MLYIYKKAPKSEEATKALQTDILTISKVQWVNFFYVQDAMICLAGCDKTIPGVTMALPRLNAVSANASSVLSLLWGGIGGWHGGQRQHNKLVGCQTVVS